MNRNPIFKKFPLLTPKILSFHSDTPERSTFSASRRTTTILDECRTNRSPATCLEQKDDHQPSISHLRHSVQFATDVRTRQIRQKFKIGATTKRLHQRPANRTPNYGHGTAQQQQQNGPQQRAERTGRRPATTKFVIRTGPAVQSERNVQSISTRFLSRLFGRFSRSTIEYAESTAARSTSTVDAYANG